MNERATYKKFITLTPLTPFFFGSELTFSADDTRDKEKARFFAESYKLPQQTTLLGMIRKEILRAKGKLRIHKNGEWVDLPKRRGGGDSEEYKAVVALTGCKAFDIFDGSSSELGIIDRLSEVFLVKDGKIYRKMPADYQLNPKKLDNIAINLGRYKKEFLIDFGIDIKKYDIDFFMHKEEVVPANEKANEEENGIFKRIETVGIKKLSEDEGFFQKISYTLKNRFSFGFFLELKEDVKFEGVVQLGGEGSLFLIKECSAFEDFQFEPKSGFDRVILLSDTLLHEDAIGYCDFILGESRVIRVLKRQYKKTKKGIRIKVLSAGSVIYTSEFDKLKGFLDNLHLQKIGMNIYTRSVG